MRDYPDLMRLGFILIALSLTACRPSVSADIGPDVPSNPVVAIVNGSEIRASDVARTLRIRDACDRPPWPGTAEERRKLALEAAIDALLERQLGKSLGTSVSDDEVDAAISKVGTKASIAAPELMVEATSRGISEAEYREEIRQQILEGRLVVRFKGRPRVADHEAFRLEAEARQRSLLDELRGRARIQIVP